MNEEMFNSFLEEFGIDKKGKVEPDSKVYRGDILSEKEILGKFVKCNIIDNSFVGRFIGKLMIYWRRFDDLGSYYSSYRFILIDKDQWQLHWFDRVGFP